ncbi:demethylmenaquinone methyltransferase / 2-methoxy-6-polyprenyl-1,4-benzoquinol methylase [Caldanaerobius fijiensis DSM 17918]|uniref:Demethylmenaquinone methyltransferase / 2-methoxy-6-polyprenyl-1,4-benzoquinol methylase n=1 Tax=Caldanaerobius fijiensis DSM 17918 TaxID=1121256 RepID=A0A1M4Z1H9_9THEO|nr:class I SAM-dependent methyltransferase [Caldanaerobius fijiensis]SHF11850.1 demethylmenaquinone methyltransferase / 2-methoxy-6-polyprenyl-1,4-benzoquinol methylase [Caldanaerobius fijiensis DSM 17918]
MGVISAISNKEFFNRVAHDWDRRVYHDPLKLKEIIELINLKDGAVVLDVGCGTGVLIPYILNKIGENGCYIGVDIAEKMLEKAREKFPADIYRNVHFVENDIMDYQSEILFDDIICYSSFPHFENKKLSIKKLSTLLKPQGKLVICHSESREKINNLHRSIGENVADDLLPSGDKVAEYMVECQLTPEMIIDDDEKYVVIGYR